VTWTGGLKWITDQRIAITVSKSTAVLFVKAAKHTEMPRPVQVLRQPIKFVQTQLIWLAHVNHMGKKTERLGVLDTLLNRRSSLSIRNIVLLYRQVIRPIMDYAHMIWRSTACSHVWKLKC
jgi:hypothetical protein